MCYLVLKPLNIFKFFYQWQAEFSMVYSGKNENITLPYNFNGKYFSSLVIRYIYIYIYGYIFDRTFETFLFMHFFVNTFELPYWFYDIWQELVNKPSIITCFPSTFCPISGHHQRRIYCKSNITFACTLLLWKNECLYWCIM